MKVQINNKLLLIILSILFFVSCDITKSKLEVDNDEVNDDKIEVVEPTKEKVEKLFKKIISEYEDLKSITLFSPDNAENHILTIELKEETLVKYLSMDLTVEDNNSNNLQLLSSSSSNCENMVLGSAYSQYQTKLGDIKHTVCENHSSGNITKYFFYPPNLIFSAAFSPNSVSFPSANFATTWQSSSRIFYLSYSPFYQGTSFLPHTSTTFNHSGTTIGSDDIEFYRIRLEKTDVLSPPTTPVLSSPANGAKISPNGTVYWLESDGNPVPTYLVNINCGSSNNQTFPTPNIYLPLSSSNLDTGETCTWRVRATNSEGTSSWSAQRSFETVPSAYVTGTWAIPVNEYGSWTATPTAGPSPYTYEWERRFFCRLGHTCPPESTSWHTAAGTGDTVYILWGSIYSEVWYKAKVKDGNNVWSNWSNIHIAYFDNP